MATVPVQVAEVSIAGSLQTPATEQATAGTLQVPPAVVQSVVLLFFVQVPPPRKQVPEVVKAGRLQEPGTLQEVSQAAPTSSHWVCAEKRGSVQ